METLIFLFVLSTISLWGYLAVSAGILGIHKSVSHSAYQWCDSFGKRALFTVALIITGFCIMPLMLELTPDTNWQFLAFICPVALCFVGATPTFQNKGIDRTVHFTAAGICAATAILWCLLFVSKGWTIVAGCGVLFGAVSLIDRKNFTYWIEIGAFALVFVPLWVKVLNLLKIGM